MPKQIFPKEVLNNTTEVHFAKHSKRSQSIYIIVLAFVIISFILLPFIHMEVNSSSRGVIRPVTDNQSLYLLSSGKVIYSKIRANLSTNKGDTLLILDTSLIHSETQMMQELYNEYENQSKDLLYLLSTENISIDSLHSFKYQKELMQHQEDVKLKKLFTKRELQNYNRYSRLYKDNVISKEEYEVHKFNYDKVVSDLALLKKQKLNSWQSEGLILNNNIRSAQQKLNDLILRKTERILIVPNSGTIMNFIETKIGSFYKGGTSCVEISSNDHLIVECLVSPKDIGFIKQGLDVKFQIDAFNYNQWGFATGKVTEIGKDINIINELPVLKVRCELNEKHLALKNGTLGILKKGLTLNARFTITNRSLFQLLFDKIDDWLNPNLNPIK